MQDYGVGNLIDEIGVNRVLILRMLGKMNQEMERLTFRDHLAALRAVAYATGRIASLLDARERLYEPYREVEKQYREYFDQVHEFIKELYVGVLGQEKWDELEFDAAMGTLKES